MKSYPTKGIVPPMVTPLLDQDTLDVEGTEKLVEHLIEGGVHGLFILGTTGEGPSLSYQLRKELIRHICQVVKERVPILVGITDSSLAESIGIAEEAKKEGAAGLVLAPPFYFNITEQELQAYLDEVLEQVELPVYLYNLPPLTKTTIPLSMINELIKCEGIVGVKDSSGDLFYFHKLNRLTNRKQCSLFIGPEELLMETLLLGGNGGVPGGANIFPRLYVGLFKSVEDEDLEQARTLHNKIIHLSSVVYSGPEGSSGKIVSGIKQVLSEKGICSNTVAKPFRPVSERKADKIQAFLKNFNQQG